MMQLTFAVALALTLSSCKPTEVERLSTDTTRASEEERIFTTSSETSFNAWSGRSDLKVGWTFETIP